MLLGMNTFEDLNKYVHLMDIGAYLDTITVF
jgi:hypothetical protein